MTVFMPPIITITGRKGAGKTELVSGIIGRLAQKGFQVAGFTYYPENRFPFDCNDVYPGAFKRAGVKNYGSITEDAAGIFFPPPSTWQELVDLVSRTCADCHLVFIETEQGRGGDRIEVVSEGENELINADESLKAVVARGPVLDTTPCFLPHDIEEISAFIEGRYLNPALSVAVLAGGRSSRLGRNKALLKINNTTIIERVLKTASAVSAEPLIITNSPSDYHYLGLETFSDIRPGGGPLSGIHAALSAGSTEYVLVVSCDIPLVTDDLIKELIRQYPGNDITIYKHTWFEPLCAVYRRTCLPALEELIDHGEYRIIDLFPTLSVRVIRTHDKEPFTSINPDEDYEYVLKKLSGKDPK